ncbi:DNA-binding protein [Streptomyces sp. NPDC001415]
MIASDPSVPLIQDLLRGLINGSMEREDVADWAMEWITDHEGEVTDPKVWDALIQLSGADLKDAPDEYLHGADDFLAWLKQLSPGE